MKFIAALRGGGKTYRLVQAVLADEAGVYVAPTWEMARMVARDYVLPERKICSAHSVSRLRGMDPRPVLYVDNFELLTPAEMIEVIMWGVKIATVSPMWEDEGR